MLPRDTRDWMAILWPSFLCAGVIEMLVFAAFDPRGINIFGLEIAFSELGAYTSAFFLFWLVCAGAMLMCWSLLRSAEAVNREQPGPRSVIRAEHDDGSEARGLDSGA